MKRTSFKQKPISAYKCARYKCGKQAVMQVGIIKVCSYACAAEKGLKLSQKAEAEENREFRRETRERREATRTRTQWYNGLQILVNRWVLHVRDKHEACCTCKTNSRKIKYDAGHCLSRGAHPELRFEVTNIHRQCSNNCNVHGSGERARYNTFIIDKYGQDHYDWLIGPHPTLKEQFPHIDDIKAEIEIYRGMLRAAGQPTNTTYKR